MKINDWPTWASGGSPLSTAERLEEIAVFKKRLENMLKDMGAKEQSSIEWMIEWTVREIIRECYHEHSMQAYDPDKEYEHSIQTVRNILSEWEQYEKPPQWLLDNWKQAMCTLNIFLSPPKRNKPSRPAIAQAIQMDLATSLIVVLKRPPTNKELLTFLRLIFGPNYTANTTRAIAEARKAADKQK